MKDIVGKFKKMKASVSSEAADPSKPPPKQFKMNLFKKSKSADTEQKRETDDGAMCVYARSIYKYICNLTIMNPIYIVITAQK